MEIISICNVHYFYNHFYTPFVIKYNDHSPMFIKNGVKKFPDSASYGLCACHREMPNTPQSGVGA